MIFKSINEWYEWNGSKTKLIKQIKDFLKKANRDVYDFTILTVEDQVDGIQMFIVHKVHTVIGMDKTGVIIDYLDEELGINDHINYEDLNIEELNNLVNRFITPIEYREKMIKMKHVKPFYTEIIDTRTEKVLGKSYWKIDPHMTANMYNVPEEFLKFNNVEL